jgi:hypothetical protein
LRQTGNVLAARVQPGDKAPGARDHSLRVTGEGEPKIPMTLLAVEIGSGSERDAGALQDLSAKAV